MKSASTRWENVSRVALKKGFPTAILADWDRLVVHIQRSIVGTFCVVVIFHLVVIVALVWAGKGTQINGVPTKGYTKVARTLDVTFPIGTSALSEDAAQEIEIFAADIRKEEKARLLVLGWGTEPLVSERTNVVAEFLATSLSTTVPVALANLEDPT